METINKAYLLDLGYKLNRSYPHDQFVTEEYQRGHLYVELTYENGNQVNAEIVIEEVFCETITAEELKALTPILGKD